MNQRAMFLLFNHTITEPQVSDAKNSLGVGDIIEMPYDLKIIWANIPPDLECLCGYLEPLKTWLEMSAQPGDYVLIQGDFGATYLTVRFAFKQGLIPVYSTTHRRAEEQAEADGSIRMLHRFEHCMFRKYGG
jgi:hypothetical protein